MGDTYTREQLDRVFKRLSAFTETLGEKLFGPDAEKWFLATERFLHQEPTWAEGMIYPPLVWSRDYGPTPKEVIPKEDEWRLPTADELSRALKRDTFGEFRNNRAYWTSTPSEGERDRLIVIVRQEDGKLNEMSERYFSGDCHHPHLRLCREVKPS